MQAIRALKLKAGEDVEDTALLGRLMAYCSKVKNGLVREGGDVFGLQNTFVYHFGPFVNPFKTFP